MKPILIAVIVSVVVVSLLFGTIRANPYFHGGETLPPTGANPPSLSLRLENNTFSQSNNLVTPFNNNSIFNSNNITFRITATSSQPKNFSNSFGLPEKWYLTDVWYVVDWLDCNNSIYKQANWWQTETNFFRYMSLTNIPEGNHTMRVFANEIGDYVKDMTKYYFNINNSVTINFAIDTIKPSISFTEDYQNKTYSSREKTLYFTTDKKDCQTYYSVDNQSFSLAGPGSSIQLINLSNGKHNVTVYAVDEYGVIGEQNTINFDVKVPEPFPTTTVAIVSGMILVLVVGIISLLLLNRQRKNQVKKV
jgi:hypothetical protein